jgi:hypothetical protein
MSSVDYAMMSDEELTALGATLAEERTRVREAQNAVAAEIEIRQALIGMSGAARDAMTLRLAGGVSPTSTTAKGK